MLVIQSFRKEQNTFNLSTSSFCLSQHGRQRNCDVEFNDDLIVALAEAYLKQLEHPKRIYKGPYKNPKQSKFLFKIEFQWMFWNRQRHIVAILQFFRKSRIKRSLTCASFELAVWWARPDPNQRSQAPLGLPESALSECGFCSIKWWTMWGPQILARSDPDYYSFGKLLILINLFTDFHRN